MDHTPLIVKAGSTCSLKDYDPDFTGSFGGKADAEEKLAKDVSALEELQGMLYAQGSHSVLAIFQAMDAAGKDGVIKHVMSGVNPQGVQVTSFKTPSSTELGHDYLWRHVCALPRRGEIGIFNRSYYEEVLIVRVHSEFLASQKLPEECVHSGIWKHRFEDINNFERYLTRNGYIVLKFFLHVSKKEQKARFLDRIDQKEKNWKFSAADLKERARWDEYMKAYEEMIGETSTEWAPWYVIPADHKWFTRVAVADVMVKKLRELNLEYPKMSDDHRAELLTSRRELEAE
ncbi:MAG: polyphosphate kinase 2 family protein [Bacteroidota bacterium]